MLLVCQFSALSTEPVYLRSVCSLCVSGWVKGWQKLHLAIRNHSPPPPNKVLARPTRETVWLSGQEVTFPSCVLASAGISQNTTWDLFRSCSAMPRSKRLRCNVSATWGGCNTVLKRYLHGIRWWGGEKHPSSNCNHFDRLSQLIIQGDKQKKSNVKHCDNICHYSTEL